MDMIEAKKNLDLLHQDKEKLESLNHLEMGYQSDFLTFVPFWVGCHPNSVIYSKAHSVRDEIALDSNQFIRLVSASHRLRL